MKAVACCLALAAALAPPLPTRAADLPQPVAPAVEAARRALVGEWRLDSARSDDTTLVLAHLAASSRVAGGASGGDPWTGAVGRQPLDRPARQGWLCVAVGPRPRAGAGLRSCAVHRSPTSARGHDCSSPTGQCAGCAPTARPPGANGVETTARWDGGRLLVETRTRGGGVVETWSASQVPRPLECCCGSRGAGEERPRSQRVFAGVTDGPSVRDSVRTGTVPAGRVLAAAGLAHGGWSPKHPRPWRSDGSIAAARRLHAPSSQALRRFHHAVGSPRRRLDDAP